MNKQKKGISLIVLVITIIVMIILATTVVVSLTNTNIIEKSRQAVFETNVSSYKHELELYLSSELVKDPTFNSKNVIVTSSTDTKIYDIIPSMNENDSSKFQVVLGKLVYVGSDTEELTWAKNLGLELDYSDKLNEDQYEALYNEEIAYAQSEGGEIDPMFSMMGGYVLNSPSTFDREKLVIPYGEDTIGFDACGGVIKLKEVVMPETIRVIDGWAFMGCTNLSKINIPDNVTYIGDTAFGWCSSLTEIKLSSKLNYLDLGAFNGCSNITKIVIPKSVNYISNNVFINCTKLVDIQVESGNTKYVAENNDLYSIDKTKLMTVAGGKTGEYVVKNTVRTIGHQSLLGCNKLTKVIVPEGVTTIESNAFASCTNLQEVVLPESLTNLLGWTFIGCTNLKTINIPTSITIINDLTFQNCPGLESFIIPNNITKIGIQAFMGCSGLGRIVIPSSVTTIGNLAFRDCTSIKDVYIEGTSFAQASSIGGGAFYNLAPGSTIHVRNATVAGYLSGKYTTSNTTISTDYTWVAPTV